MHRNLLLLGLLIVGGLLVCPVRVLSQGFIPPPGESLISKDIQYCSNGHMVRIATTSGGVYFSRYINHHWIKDTKVWNCPSALTIATGSECGPGDNRYNVVLSNCQVWRIRLNICTDGSVISEWNIPSPPVTGSVGVEKLTGDALYMLTSSGLFVSRDSTTWQLDTAGIGAVTVRDVALDTAQFVYAATDSGLYVQNPDSNVWHRVTSLTQKKSMYSVFVDRVNRIFVGGNGGGLYVSTDNGSTWTTDTSGIGNQVVSKIGDDAYGNIYIAAGGRIYRSDNGSSSWVDITAGILSITVNLPTFTSIGGDTVLLAATSFGMYSSSDLGSTWAESDSGIGAEHMYGAARGSGSSFLVSTALGVFAGDPVAGTWTKSYPQNGYEAQLPLYSDGLGNIYILDQSRGQYSNGAVFVAKSTDGGSTWSPDTAGLSPVNGSLYNVDETGAQHYGNTFYGSTRYCYLWKKPAGGSWTLDTAGFPVQNYSFVTSFASDRNGYVYVSGYFAGKRVMRRPASGGSWVIDTVGIPSSISYFSSMAGANGDVVGASGSTIMHRPSGIWTKIPLPSQLTFPILTLMSMNDSGIVFASFKDLNSVGLGVYFTRDAGTTWTYAGLDSLTVTSLAASGDSVLAFTDHDGLYALNSSGIPLPIQLASLTGTLAGRSVIIRWLTITETNNLGFYVERQSEGSILWTTVSGLIQGAGTTLAQHQYAFTDTAVTSGTYYYRIRQVDLTGTQSYSQPVKIVVTGVLSVKDKVTPIEFSLEQNYPNPFNPTTKINYALPVASSVRLVVYNLLGQVVSTLADGVQDAGYKTVQWNAGSVASGLYIYRIEATSTSDPGKSFLQVRKMILMK